LGKLTSKLPQLEHAAWEFPLTGALPVEQTFYIQNSAPGAVWTVWKGWAITQSLAERVLPAIFRDDPD